MAWRCALFLCVPGMKMVEPLRAHHKQGVAQSDQESEEVGDHDQARCAEPGRRAAHMEKLTSCSARNMQKRPGTFWYGVSECSGCAGAGGGIMRERVSTSGAARRLYPTLRSLWANLPRRTGLCPERHKVPELGPASTAHCDTREELTLAMAGARSRAGCLGWLAVSGRLASVLVHVIGMAWARQLGAIFSDHHRTGRVRRLCSVIGMAGRRVTRLEEPAHR